MRKPLFLIIILLTLILSGSFVAAAQSTIQPARTSPADLSFRLIFIGALSGYLKPCG